MLVYLEVQRQCFNFTLKIQRKLNFTSQAMKSGFTGGLVVDYPNSTKAKKFFLVLMTGGNQQLPKALGTESREGNHIQYENTRDRIKKSRGKPLKKSRDWIL